jgi:FtsZ-interacting cell division protein ZipA
MAALRWILLGVGLVFLAALAVWELRRPRQGAARGEPALGAAGETAAGAAPGPGAPAGTRLRTPAPQRVELPPLEPETAFAPTPSAGAAADPSAEIQVQFDAPPAGARAGPLPSGQGAPAPGDLPVLVLWPPEAERVVLALRIVPLGEEPLSGRAIRQSLGACGFVHGPLQIFHQPGADGYALLSAASLRNPGTLDPATMDFQRFAGLSLFAVLPGPLEGPAALDHLLHTGRDLTQRLHAALQDERGAPLDAARIESLRRAVQGLPGTGPRAEPAA